jgi:hypothetical protein
MVKRTTGESPFFTRSSRDGRIEHVFYPVFPPDKNAETVIAWLTTHPV